MPQYRFVTIWRLQGADRPGVLAPLPFGDEIFRLDHHAVMRGGRVGIRQRLGRVASAYDRED